MKIKYAFVAAAHAVLFDKNISDGAFRTYLMLKARAMNKDWCIVSQKRLAEDRNISVRTARFHVNELKSSGLVEVQKKLGSPAKTILLRLTEHYDDIDVPFVSALLHDSPEKICLSDRQNSSGRDFSLVEPVDDCRPNRQRVTGSSYEEEEEEEESPSEGKPPFPQDRSGGEPEDPTPSGPGGEEQKELAPASDCAETARERWWADDILFSDIGKVEKPSRKRKTGATKTSTRVKTATPVWSLWTHFRRTVEDRWPEMNIPFKPVGREWANLKKMLDEFGEVDCKRIIEIAVADWNAICEMWPRVARGQITTFYAVFTLRSDLMAAVASGSGVTTRSNRVSEYAKRMNADRPAQAGWGDLFD